METLKSCLKQSYRPIEIIIQDGGSTDETVSILRALNAPEVLWTSEPDAGVVDAVNKGLQIAAGEHSDHSKLRRFVLRRGGGSCRRRCSVQRSRYWACVR